MSIRSVLRTACVSGQWADRGGRRDKEREGNRDMGERIVFKLGHRTEPSPNQIRNLPHHFEAEPKN